MTVPRRPANATNPPILRDAPIGETAPQNFRTTSDAVPPVAGEAAPALAGLSDLHASGSAQFTPSGLGAIVARVRGPLTVFDLRQESHGFIGAEPVTWYAEHDWVSVGSSHGDALADEARRLADLRARPTALVAAKDDERGTSPAPIAVTAVLSEAEVVEALGARYVRLTVTDHLRPSDAEVDRFIAAVRALPAGAWAHFHCRAGKGRTTTFMVLYDMLRNARRVTLDDIVLRVGRLSAEYDVLHVPAADDWKQVYQSERAAFVRAFYEYARTHEGGAGATWSEWLAAQR
jgi:protein-tyrosine phosphatase